VNWGMSIMLFEVKAGMLYEQTVGVEREIEIAARRMTAKGIT
jgi:hypothetical protein